MRNNSKDETIKRNYVQVYRHYIEEYEQVKHGLHPRWQRVGEFYAAHGIQRQTFLKYYGRWRNSGQDPTALLPLKRGPRWKTRRTPAEVEALVRECHALCVSGLAHAGFRYGYALKRCSNRIANWLRAANHSLTFRPPFSKLRMAR